MRTAIDAPYEALDSDERDFVVKIKEHGWFKTSVLDDEDIPNFSYTTGFWLSTATPEIITFSLKRETLHNILWEIFRDFKKGRKIIPGTRTDDVFANLPVYFFNVSKTRYKEHLGWSLWFYGGDSFPCLQMVWPDPEGRFPWEQGFDQDFANDQPDLTERGWSAELVN